MRDPGLFEQDVVIVGAGPAGTVAGSLLRDRGYTTTIIERQHFPRFSIGESLLPQCMAFLEESGLLPAVQQAGFQSKNGAAFELGDVRTEFRFDEKFTAGWASTFEVQRDRFDKILADEAEKKGVLINYGEEVTDVKLFEDGVEVGARASTGEEKAYRGRFLLDASGFGRVLPRMLDLDAPSSFPARQSIFTHVEDRIASREFDREKILITIHRKHHDVWYWLIPFSDGRSSIGVVAEDAFLNERKGDDAEVLRQLVGETDGMSRYLGDAVYDQPVRKIAGYASNVKSLWGQNFALLGNAGEFLDPVFSSGVTIAMKSASLVVPLVDRVLSGDDVDWEEEYVTPLMVGVDTFRTYVEGWYDRSFQHVIFHPKPIQNIKAMICSILAGYAWDERNPFVKHSRRRLSALAEIASTATAR